MALKRRRFREKATTRIIGTAICVLAAGLTWDRAVAQAAANTSNAPATQLEALVLRVNLNSESKGDLFVQRSGDQDFLLKVEDLKAIGFSAPAGAIQLIEGQPHLSLRSMSGVTFSFDEKALALNITAEPKLLPPTTLTLLAERRRGTSTRSTSSAFFNYAINTARGSGASSGLGFAGELGVQTGHYLFLSDASTVDTPDGKRLVRLMSSVSRDDPANLRRWTVGDILTPSRDFSSGLNLGGIGVTKLYGLDPYFVRFPTQTLTGSVALPSDLEVYLDGQRVRSERLRPGEFELRDLLAFGGARNVQVVLRDAFGRVQQLSYSVYFSDQPLQPGLHEYSYNVGALRRQYGLQSNSYGPAAATMFHRYGFTNAVTLGWRTEATGDLVNAGPTATVVLGSLGVANLALAQSTIAGRQGTAGMVSYSYQSQHWSAGLFLRRDSGDYASMGDPPIMTNRKYEGSASIGYRLPGYGTVSLSHTALTVRGGVTAATATAASPFNVSVMEARRVTALSYSSPIAGGRAQLTASVSHTKSPADSRNEAFVGLTFFLDRDYSAAATYRSDRQTHSESLRFTKNQPVGEGLGYSVSLDRFSSDEQSTQLRGDIQYNAPVAVLRADYGRFRAQGQQLEDLRLSVAGGIVAAGGQLAMSRPVTDSFAIVKVGDVPGVGISVDGLRVGKTNDRGFLVIPSLSAYYESSVSIAHDSLPMDYALPADVKRVLPSFRSGAYVDFGAVKTQAFSGRLYGQAGGASRPAEFQEIAIKVDGQTRLLPTGRGGEFYVENLKAGSYPATAAFEGAPCTFDLNIPSSQDALVELGRVDCVPRP